MSKSKIMLATALCALVTAAGCTDNPNTNAVIGGLTGAALGSAVGNGSGNTAAMLVGGAAGAAIGANAPTR